MDLPCAIHAVSRVRFGLAAKRFACVVAGMCCLAADGAPSAFNLDALVLLGCLGEHVDVDLWHYRSEESGGIRAALDYVAPFADGSKAWPHGRNATDAERSRLLPLLRQGFRAYGYPEYLHLIERIPAKHRERDASRLRFPTGLLVAPEAEQDKE